MSTVIDFRMQDTHQHDKRVLDDGSIDVPAGELLSLKAELWLAKNVTDSAGLDGIEAWPVKGA